MQEGRFLPYLGKRNGLTVGNGFHVAQKLRNQFQAVGINPQISSRKGVSYSKKKKKKSTAKNSHFIHKAITLESLAFGLSLYRIEKMAEQLLSNVVACCSSFPGM